LGGLIFAIEEFLKYSKIKIFYFEIVLGRPVAPYVEKRQQELIDGQSHQPFVTVSVR
jgi:hypothetical protein